LPMTAKFKVFRCGPDRDFSVWAKVCPRWET
jgi:hypothetical protein